MDGKVHSPTGEYLWDVQNRTRMGCYLTATELDCIKTGLHGSHKGIVLDVGCGSGKISVPLSGMGFEVVSLECDFGPLRWFRRQEPDARLLNGDAIALPFVDCCFDIIVAVELLDYVEARGRFYKEAYRTLRPGGTLMATLTNKLSIKGAIYGLYLFLARRRRMRRYYEMTYRGGIGEMAEAGFKIRSARGYNWNLLPRDSDSILVDAFAVMEKVLRADKLPSLSPLVFITATKEG
jgi:SAM-dependent methyltransferase